MSQLRVVESKDVRAGDGVLFKVSIYQNARGKWNWKLFAYGPANFATREEAKAAALRAIAEALRTL
jgi:hypothetical protein